MKLKTRYIVVTSTTVIAVILTVLIVVRTLSKSTSGKVANFSQQQMSITWIRSEYRKYAGKTLPAELMPIRDIEVEETQTKRQRQLNASCEKVPTGGGASAVRHAFSNLYVDDSRRFIYCLIDGVGSSRWSRVLLHDTNRISQHNVQRVRYLSDQTANEWRQDGQGPLVPLHPLYFSPNEITDRLRRYYKFVFFRHPIDRLVSAYLAAVKGSTYQSPQDGGAATGNHQLQPDVGKKSKSRSHGNGNLSDLQRLQRLRLLQLLYMKSIEVFGKNRSFPEFVRFILLNRLNETESNRHPISPTWRPQTELCQPCAISYDFLGRFETLHRDAYHVLNAINLRRVRFPDEFEQPSSDPSPEVVDRLMSELTFDDIAKLRLYYQSDFSMLNYTYSVNNQVTAGSHRPMQPLS